MGHHVQEAASGKQALAMVGDHDLIVLDYAMPGMNGAEVANELKRTGVQIPVLFASGFADTEALKQTAGDAPVLQKPFSLVELAKCINDLVPQTSA
jgi:CheY-like chemotaxis protein